MINLGVNAMKVYRAMDPSGGLYEKLVAAKAPSTFAAVWTLEGHEARRLWLEELDQANVAQYGLTSQRMAWFDFQTALRSHLPDDCVHVDHAFHRFSEDDEGVLVTFNDGSAAVRCKLLIGADGVNSQVRRQLAEGRCEARVGGPTMQGPAIRRRAVSNLVVDPLCDAASNSSARAACWPGRRVLWRTGTAPRTRLRGSTTSSSTPWGAPRGRPSTPCSTA